MSEGYDFIKKLVRMLVEESEERLAAAKLQRSQAIQEQREAMRAQESQTSFQTQDGYLNVHEPPMPSPALPSPTGRFPRVRRVPKALRDSNFLPHSLSLLPQPLRNLAPPPAPLPAPPPSTDAHNESLPPAEDAVSPLLHYIDSEVNGFGLYRSYLTIPLSDPEATLSLDDQCDAPTITVPQLQPRAWWTGFGTAALRRHVNESIFAPFLNATTFRLMNWFYSGSSMKSLGELDRLVNEVLLADDFNCDDLRGFSAAREAHRLDDWEDIDNESPFSVGDGWHESSVKIRVPAEGIKHVSEEDSPEFEIPGVFHRSLTEIIRSVFQSSTASNFHLIPFKLFATHPESTSSSRSNSSPPSPDADDAQRVYSEVYNSDAMIEEYEHINSSYPILDSEATLQTDGVKENVIAAIMFWSDSTHLASFGNASLWPIYMFFGNQSKYSRTKPSEFAAHHLAYLPSLPDNFQDWYSKVYNDAPSAEVLTHCKRELMHAIWRLILDKDFLYAYEHGIVMKFADGIIRRVFPRIFTYSADYPEKVLIATLRFLANSPCPRCLILKKDIHALGTEQDRRRRSRVRIDDEGRRSAVERCRDWIYTRGYRIRSKAVEAWLAGPSWVPTRNAFSDSLHCFGLNFHNLLVPDLLHEFELGVWKATFTHLLRVLIAAGGDGIQRLNTRYRLIPTFGRDTIRRFVRNTADMKKLAARDFEDILQCSMPVFEGLLEEPYNSIVLDLLWALATWQALAKLRMHTSSTLHCLETATSALGQHLRRFKADLCSQFATKELPRETAARGRRTAALVGKGKAPARRGGRVSTKAKGKGRANQAVTPSVGVTDVENAGATDTGPRLKIFSLITYKLHALGDYVKFIKLFGTSDNTSTQTGELEHRRVKRFYARTNKWRFVRQISKQQRREELLRRMAKKLRLSEAKSSSINTNIGTTSLESSTAIAEARPTITEPSVEAASTQPQVAEPSSTERKGRKPSKKGKDVIFLPFDAQDPLVSVPPSQHHHISETKRYGISIPTWLAHNHGDRALQDFFPRLKDHILSRVTGQEYHDAPEFSNDDRSSLHFVNNTMYRHKAMRINYTSYDMRRGQDSLNPRTHTDIMVLAHEDDDQREGSSHPYWYARIIGIFHVYVIRTGSDRSHGVPQKIEFLWVRWFGRDLSYKSGFQNHRLPRVGFVDSEDQDAFGFLDPQDVIRGVHLIPAFAHGTTEDLLGPSVARQPSDNDEDWQYYYVNIFVDRDMFMRFLGGGIGHRATTSAATRLHAVPVPTIASDATSTSEPEDELIGDGEDQLRPTFDEDHDDASEAASDTEPNDAAPYDEGEHDYGYELSESEDEGMLDEHNDEGMTDDVCMGSLGAEDGEDITNVDEDLYAAEGYAPL